MASRSFPKSPVENVVETFHGVEVADPYRWLEEDKSPEVRAWTDAQTAFLRAALDGYPGRAWIQGRLCQLFGGETLGTPYPVRSSGCQGARLFHTRRRERQNQPVLCVRETQDGPSRVLVDPNALAEDGRFALDWWFPSRDGGLVAYGLSEFGDEVSTLYVVEVATARVLPDRIPRTRACSLAWLSSGAGFYYTRFPRPGDVPAGEEDYHCQVFLHLLGADPRTDLKVYEPNVGWSAWLTIALTPNDRFLVVEVGDGSLRSDVYLVDRKDPGFSRPIPVVEGKPAIYTLVEATDSRVYVVCNEDAPHWRLMAFDPAAPANWQQVIPERDEILQSVVLSSDRVITLYKKDAASCLRVCSHDGETQDEVPLPGLGTVSELVGYPGVSEVFFKFTSFLTPEVIHRLDPSTARTSMWSQSLTPVDAANFVVRQVRYSSRDGTSVPLFLVHRKNLVPDGRTPTLLYGYGGFNLGVSPWFSPMALPFVECGGVFAVAALRGGDEFGEHWHRAGILEKKQNVFDDFVAAAEYLIATRVTSPERLAISGRSNGGLLIAAVLTQRPDLFKAAVSGVPLTDMLRYHRFGFARLWAPEYGCAENPEHFPWLHAYSPYHCVREGVAYPPTLIFASETDGRVAPMHARKMVARLQAATGGPRAIYLRMEAEGGHGALGVGKPTSQLIGQHLDELSFLFEQLGMQGPWMA